MKRLVYAPQVNAWIKTDTGIFDLSPYITEFSVNRKVNAASTATLTFRNPKVEQIDGQNRFLFTHHERKETNGDISYGPMFHPMDPIIITLTRLKGHPVQVFTGYCDKVPYIQLFPGIAHLTASCTLKRLMYTYWDPGLVFVNHYMMERGWTPTPDGVALNAEAEANVQGDLNDSSIGRLIYDILVDVGGWKHEDIFVQEIPSKEISAAVSAIYQDLTGDAKASFEVFRNFLNEIVGTGNIGGGNIGTANTSNTGTGGSGGTDTIPYDGKEGKLTPEEAKAAARSLLKNYGWQDSEWPSLKELWEHESNWRWDANNPSSGAYGIPQSLPGNKMATVKSDWQTNAVTQIKWGLNYIKQRYGSPSAAWSFWQNPTNSPAGASTHWY